MTRKQAILEAISILEAKNTPKEIIDKLDEILHNIINIRWSKELIIDTFESFIIEYKRIPTTKECDYSSELPEHAVISYFFKQNPIKWINSNFTTINIKTITRKLAIQYVIENIDNQEIKGIFISLLKEYPKTQWTVENVSDCLIQFWIENGRLPYQAEYTRKNNMPNLSTFQYQWGITKSQWIDKYLPEYAYLENEREDKLYSLESFIKEYNRIKPTSLDEFEANRNPNKVHATYCVARHHKVSGWRELIEICKLEVYQSKDTYWEEERKKIKGVEIIIV